MATGKPERMADMPFAQELTPSVCGRFLTRILVMSCMSCTLSLDPPVPMGVDSRYAFSAGIYRVVGFVWTALISTNNGGKGE